MSPQERKQYKRDWAARNKDKIKCYGQKYYLSHKDGIRKRTDAWKAANPQAVLEMARASAHKNRAEIIKKRRAKWWANRESNLAEQRARRAAVAAARPKRIKMPPPTPWKERNAEHIRIYDRERYRSNPCFCIKRRLSSRLTKLLRCLGVRKTYRAEAIIGCTLADLKAHLESKFLPGMSWEKRHLWHIDHKRPCSSFDLAIVEEQKKCFHYTNLQPLWWHDNIIKGDKYTE